MHCTPQDGVWFWYSLAPVHVLCPRPLAAVLARPSPALTCQARRRPQAGACDEGPTPSRSPNLDPEDPTSGGCHARSTRVYLCPPNPQRAGGALPEVPGTCAAEMRGVAAVREARAPVPQHRPNGRPPRPPEGSGAAEVRQGAGLLSGGGGGSVNDRPRAIAAECAVQSAPRGPRLVQCHIPRPAPPAPPAPAQYRPQPHKDPPVDWALGVGVGGHCTTPAGGGGGRAGGPKEKERVAALAAAVAGRVNRGDAATRARLLQDGPDGTARTGGPARPVLWGCVERPVLWRCDTATVPAVGNRCVCERLTLRGGPRAPEAGGFLDGIKDSPGAMCRSLGSAPATPRTQ